MKIHIIRTMNRCTKRLNGRSDIRSALLVYGSRQGIKLDTAFAITATTG